VTSKNNGNAPDSETAERLLGELDDAECTAKADREYQSAQSGPDQERQEPPRLWTGADLEPAVAATFDVIGMQAAKFHPALSLTHEESAKLGAAWAPIAARYLDIGTDKEMARALAVSGIIIAGKVWDMRKAKPDAGKPDPEPKE